MNTVYQYNLAGYYQYETQAFNSLMPNNTTDVQPILQTGFIPKWNGTSWEQIENHKGEEGYVNGEPFTIKEYGAYPDGFTTEAPEKPLAEKQTQVRSQRDSLLSACDFTQMPDNPLSDAEKEAWRIYRQALRDITEDPLFATEPESVTFPEKP